jgi:hypothetical protein
LRKGRSAVYDGSRSKAFGAAPVTYRWTLPDGSHASTPSVRYRATDTGDTDLTLTVRGSDGRTATTTKTVHVVP